MPAGDYIWRLENSDGRGVYNAPGDPLSPFNGTVGSYGGYAHPAPWEDGLNLWVRGRDIFGFRSLAQARRWFDTPEDGDVMDRFDIQLAAYPKAEVGTVQHGSSQVAFDPADARPVRLPIHRLWDTSARDLGRLADAQRLPHAA